MSSTPPPDIALARGDALEQLIEERILALLDENPGGISFEELAAKCRCRGWANDNFSGYKLAAAMGCEPTDIIRRE
jgi:hypothetical protein